MTAACATTALDVETQLDACRLEVQQAQERETWLRMVIDTANDAFVSTNLAGEILEWNSKAEELFGWTHDEAVGKRLSETIFTPDVSGRGTGGLQYLIKVKNKGQRIETKASTRDGSEMPVEVSIAPMRIGNSFVLNAFIHDITSRKILQSKLAHAHKMESVGQLSAGIAHEINTPTQYVGDNSRFLQESFVDLMQVFDAYDGLLQAIDGGGDVGAAASRAKSAADEADLDYLKSEVHLAIEQSLEGVERVASIVRAMKEFSPPGSVCKTPTDLNQGIRNTITVATHEWKYVAEVETDLDETLPLVPCLPGDLNQVILNLIVNGAQAIGEKIGEHPTEKGRIHIASAHTKKHVEIRIRDSGNGIPDAIVNRIFDPFFTTKDVGVGSGQGLAIARSVVVEKHSGTLEVETAVGEGTTFIIQLPLEG
ncbi:MAG: PAS domain S-box protein [Planctomycetota bacterium]